MMNKLTRIFIFLASVLFAQLSYSAQSLSYPGDCKNKTLESAAKKNGCSITDGGSHWKVMKNGAMITTIPYSVKENDTCRAIIKVINAQC
jgi:hypothetical protein